MTPKIPSFTLKCSECCVEKSQSEFDCDLNGVISSVCKSCNDKMEDWFNDMVDTRILLPAK